MHGSECENAAGTEGCEKVEDMGPVVRFTCPYVYIEGEKQWFRLTGGNPSEILKDITV